MKTFTSPFALLLIFSLNLYQISSLRILALFPLHARSHDIMGEELALGLAAKGHQLDVYGHFPLNKSVPNLQYTSLKGTLVQIQNNITFKQVMPNCVSQTLPYWVKAQGTQVCQLLELPVFQKLLNQPPKDPPYDLIITEISVTNCYVAVGRHLNIPVIGIVTPPMIDWQYEAFGNPINLATVPSFCVNFFPPMSFLQKVENVITYHVMKQSFSRYSLEHDQILKRIFGPSVPRSIDLLKDVDLVLANHDLSLSGMHPFAPKVIPVGGLHVVDHNDSLAEDVAKWLDESEHGCVYFSFGSMVRIETFPKQILDAFYKSFESIAPVRVLMKIVKPEELPPGLPDNVMIQPWFQQVQVLKHPNVKVFVSHAGLMGTHEAMHFGVPMLGIPLIADQPLNIATLVSRKTAIKLDVDKITEETFINALKELLFNPDYKKNAENLSRKSKDKPASLMNTAIFWIEYIGRHGKDALSLPEDDMPWWQSSLLDVYTFIMALVLLVLYLTWKFIRITASFLQPIARLISNSKLEKIE